MFQGISLSGGDSEESRRDIENGMLAKFPNAANAYDISNDTMCPVATASDSGGVAPRSSNAQCLLCQVYYIII